MAVVEYHGANVHSELPGRKSVHLLRLSSLPFTATTKKLPFEDAPSPKHPRHMEEESDSESTSLDNI